MEQHGDDFVILVPVFNEEACIPRLQRELIAFLGKSPVSTSVLFINDGSHDESQRLMETCVASDHRFKLIKLSRNSGLSAALKAGIDHCQCRWIGYLDADLQTTPLDFIVLMNHIHNYDLVTGIRTQRNDNRIRKVSSRVANRFRRMIIHDEIEDTCCPLKIGRAEILKSLPFFHGMHRFIPALVQMVGGTVKQVPVRHFPRIEGVAKYNMRNRLVGPFLDTLAFRWMQQRYIRYEIEKAM
jgi:dolichol-phosphate mannosyltransferase